MRKCVFAMLLATAFLAVLTVSAEVHAGSEYSSGSMMSGGMMGRSMEGNPSFGIAFEAADTGHAFMQRFPRRNQPQQNALCS